MRRIWRMRWLVAGVLLLALAAMAGILLLRSGQEPATTLTSSEVSERVLGQYGGEIVRLDRLSDSYRLTLETERGIYELLLGSGGETRSIRRLEAYELPGTGGDPGETPGGAPEQPGGETPSLPLTEQEAIKVALGQVFGKVEDVELRSAGGERYYLIEIETPQGREADIQVHAITGTVMSVTWDDDEDER